MKMKSSRYSKLLENNTLTEGEDPPSFYVEFEDVPCKCGNIYEDITNVFAERYLLKMTADDSVFQLPPMECVRCKDCKEIFIKRRKENGQEKI